MSYNLTTKGHKYCIVVGIICNRSFKTIRYNTMSFILINNMSEKLQDAHIKSNTTCMIQSDKNCPPPVLKLFPIAKYETSHIFDIASI